MKLPWKVIGQFVLKQVVPIVISAAASALAAKLAKPAAPSKTEA